MMHDGLGKILVVDDEKTNIDVLVGLLNDDYKVFVAKNGHQALKRVQSEPTPDLILLDIVMPDLDGFEVCRQLKANPETKDIPIIFITGMNQIADETHGLELGAVDFIRKPFFPNVVLARIRTHLELLQQRQRLMELNQLKNKFLGMAAHDLRNPLNSICGLADILLNLKLTEEEQRKFIQTIHNVSQQMSTLVDDLLDVSVIESGQFNIKLRPGNLAELVQSRIDLFRFAAEQKNITLQRHFLPTRTTAFDPERLAQVVDNLLANAVKFSNSGTIITIATGEDAGMVWFSVADQGPGISEEDRSRLFGAFQKLTARPTGKEKSTGLGLSIVKKIVDAHQGKIVVTSAIGQGSIFTVHVPSLRIDHLHYLDRSAHV
ncbi:MAG: hybrid sensor histidine kinase/response regulator [Magnetococcales bacterium]|nr:hybrid sensor histidine kinase/response regulator [Magnetococcales bacterium]